VPRQGNNGSVEVEPKLLVQKSLALYVALFKQGFRVDGGANCKIDTNLNTQLLRFHFVSPEFTQANMASRTAFIGSLLTTSDWPPPIKTPGIFAMQMLSTMRKAPKNCSADIGRRRMNWNIRTHTLTKNNYMVLTSMRAVQRFAFIALKY
jgi:hypothetical protein